MRSHRFLSAVLAVVIATVAAVGFGTTPAMAASYTPITGEGSSWAANAIQDWGADVVNKGIKVNFTPDGSVAGLTGFTEQNVDDFAASDIPYGIKGVSPDPPGRGFAYLPDVAGGTALMYNLSVGGQRVTNLKLSGPTIAGIFSGAINSWNAPQIKADNPGLNLPPLKITPVVRSDGSGSTAQFTLWMAKEFPSDWKCGEVSLFTSCSYYTPTVQQSKAGDNGVAGFVAQAGNAGSIGYVEYSYALQSGFPVAKVLNKSGFYVLPTASNVAVALLKAQINTTPGPNYLTQDLDQVYVDTDPRAYPISSYSYFVIPTAVQDGFTTAKGLTLGAFTDYALCEGQQKAPALGYSPLPINLVEDGMTEIKRIPGAQAKSINIASCNNPTFSTNGTNTLAKNALYPDLCDKKGAKPNCVYGTPVSGKTSSSGNGQNDNNSQGAHTSGSGGSSSTGGTGTTTTTGGTGSSGSTGGTGTTGGTTGGSGLPGSTNPSTGGAGTGTGTGDGSGGAISLLNPDGRTYCDPDTGQCSQLAASPVEVPSSHGSGMALWAMLLIVAGLIAMIIVPPVLVFASRRAAR